MSNVDSMKNTLDTVKSVLYSLREEARLSEIE